MPPAPSEQSVCSNSLQAVRSGKALPSCPSLHGQGFARGASAEHAAVPAPPAHGLGRPPGLPSPPPAPAPPGRLCAGRCSHAGLSEGTKPSAPAASREIYEIPLAASRAQPVPAGTGATADSLLDARDEKCGAPGGTEQPVPTPLPGCNPAVLPSALRRPHAAAPRTPAMRHRCSTAPCAHARPRPAPPRLRVAGRGSRKRSRHSAEPGASAGPSPPAAPRPEPPAAMSNMESILGAPVSSVSGGRRRGAPSAVVTGHCWRTGARAAAWPGRGWRGGLEQGRAGSRRFRGRSLRWSGEGSASEAAPPGEEPPRRRRVQWGGGGGGGGAARPSSRGSVGVGAVLTHGGKETLKGDRGAGAAALRWRRSAVLAVRAGSAAAGDRESPLLVEVGLLWGCGTRRMTLQGSSECVQPRHGGGSVS